MKSKEEQEYEERVRRRVLILRDLMNEGKIVFADRIKESLEESFGKARYDENGQPDLETIDGQIRSLALMAEQVHHRTKLKNAITLYEIQRRYFEIIHNNFYEFYEMMKEYKTTPDQIATYTAYKGPNIDSLNEPIEDLLKEIEEFWELLAEPGYLHLEDDRKTIKAVFGGDLFPTHNENIASKCGIYTDTIILPCPFIRSRHLFKRWSKEERVYFLIKHGLNVLQYMELALAELDKPIVVILPDKEMMAPMAFEEIKKLGDKDALYHAEKVFDRKFGSLEELLEFGESLDTVDKVIKEVKDKQKVLFDTEFKDTLKVQIQNQMEGQSGQLMNTNHPGIIVSMLGVGRMSVTNELLAKSLLVGGVPLIDAPTSWEYFKWKIQYDAERANPNREYFNLHVVKGLNGLSNTNLNWIGKIPPSGLIEIRKNGAINEIREILSRGIDELVSADQLDFTSTSHRVFNNLNSAFNQHQENIKKLTKKKWQIAGKDFGSWLAKGSVEIASACVGHPLYGASYILLDQLIDAPKIKDLTKTIDKIKELEKSKGKLEKSPVGLMFQYK